MAPLERMNNACLILPDDPNLSLRSVSSTETNTDVAVPLKSLFEEPKPQRKPKKQVSFSQYSIMYHVPSVDTFTQEELDQAFTTEADYDRIHNENEITLAYMERGIYPDDEKLCFRGLEGGMRHIYTEKKRLTADAVSAVLKRQAERKDLDDNEWARHYYATYTYQSLANAFRIGAWDAQTNQI